MLGLRNMTDSFRFAAPAHPTVKARHFKNMIRAADHAAFVSKLKVTDQQLAPRWLTESPGGPCTTEGHFFSCKLRETLAGGISCFGPKLQSDAASVLYGERVMFRRFRRTRIYCALRNIGNIKTCNPLSHPKCRYRSTASRGRSIKVNNPHKSRGRNKCGSTTATVPSRSVCAAAAHGTRRNAVAPVSSYRFRHHPIHFLLK